MISFTIGDRPDLIFIKKYVIIYMVGEYFLLRPHSRLTFSLICLENF